MEDVDDLGWVEAAWLEGLGLRIWREVGWLGGTQILVSCDEIVRRLTRVVRMRAECHDSEVYPGDD